MPTGEFQIMDGWDVGLYNGTLAVAPTVNLTGQSTARCVRR
jgi:hypothetical protein